MFLLRYQGLPEATAKLEQDPDAISAIERSATTACELMAGVGNDIAKTDSATTEQAELWLDLGPK